MSGANHPTPDPNTCDHGVPLHEECDRCWHDHRVRVDSRTSNERSIELRAFADILRDTGRYGVDFADVERASFLSDAADEIDRQRAEIELLTKQRDRDVMYIVDMEDTISRAAKALGVTNSDALLEKLESPAHETANDLRGTPATPNRAEAIAALLDVAAALTDSERGMAADSLREYARIKRSAEKATSERLTDEQCDDVIAFLEDYECTGLTRENVRTWCTAIAEATSSVNGKADDSAVTQKGDSNGN